MFMNDSLLQTTNNKPSPSPYLDILHKQSEDSDVEYHIPIRKIKFEDTPKPTELAPEKPQKSTVENKFAVPNVALDYLDDMIFRRKIPVRSLRFDIENSTSISEAVKYLTNARVDEEDRKKLLSFFGDKKTEEVTVFNESSFDSKLEEARVEYASELVPHLQKTKSHRKVYEKMMSSLGEDREMPKKAESRELVHTRDEYFKVREERSKSLFGTNGDVSDAVLEVSKLQDEVIKKHSTKEQKFVNKALKLWDANISDVHETVTLPMLGDVEFVAHRSRFDGLRTNDPVVLDQNQTPVVQVEKRETAPVVVKNTVLSKNGNIELDFEGKKLDIVRGGEEGQLALSVLLDKKEIARGFLTNKGPDIKIHKEFKHMFLMVDTEEERAFKKAMVLIKTFKL